jgi:RNA polymerase sigma-70 factor (ECF subfamily)
LDEAEAIARVKRRDLSGLEVLVQLYQQQAVRLAVFITRDLPTAEDVVSDCFLLAYERAAQFDDRRPFRPWFLRIVANAALKVVRRQSKLMALEPNEAEPFEHQFERLLDPMADPDMAVEQAGVREAVRAALAALSPKQRAVLALRYYVGLSEAETAQALGIPSGTVKSRLSAGMGRLRTLLADWRSR